MSDFQTIGEDFLSHYGKKGMHWGVHTKKTRVAEKKWIAEKLSPETQAKILSKGFVSAGKEISEVNKRYTPEALKDKRNQKNYLAETQDLVSRHMDAAAKEEGISPSGDFQLKARYNESHNMVVIGRQRTSQSTPEKVLRIVTAAVLLGQLEG
jgi:hypothetical protein